MHIVYVVEFVTKIRKRPTLKGGGGGAIDDSKVCIKWIVGVNND